MKPPHPVLALLALLTGPLAPAGVVAGADSLADCRAITEDAARLACYDALADGPARPGIAPATAGVPLAAATPPPASPLPSPEELFGRDTEVLRQATGLDQLDELVGTVTATEQTQSGKVILQLDNGQVWLQVDTSSIGLRGGEQVRIRRASLGSYLLSELGHNRSIRVRRVE